MYFGYQCIYISNKLNGRSHPFQREAYHKYFPWTKLMRVQKSASVEVKSEISKKRILRNFQDVLFFLIEVPSWTLLNIPNILFLISRHAVEKSGLQTLISLAPGDIFVGSFASKSANLPNHSLPYFLTKQQKLQLYTFLQISTNF